MFIKAKGIDELIVNVGPYMDVLSLFLQVGLLDRASGFPSDIMGSIVKPQIFKIDDFIFVPIFGMCVFF